MATPKKASKTALMMYGASESDSNLYYAVKFVVPDPFPYFQIGSRKIILMSDLELGRAQKQAKVDEVISYSDLQIKTAQKGEEKPRVADVTAYFLRSRGISKVIVPDDFNLGLADALRKKGIAVVSKPDPFFEERVYKSKEEVRMITQSLRHTEAAIHKLEDVLRKSKIAGKKLSLSGPGGDFRVAEEGSERFHDGKQLHWQSYHRGRRQPWMRPPPGGKGVYMGEPIPDRGCFSPLG